MGELTLQEYMKTKDDDFSNEPIRYDKDVPGMSYDNLYTLWLQDQKTVLALKDLFEKDYEMKLLLDSTKERGVKIVNIKTVNKNKPSLRIVFQIIESPSIYYFNRRWLVIEETIKVFNSLKRLFIPNDKMEAVTVFLREVMEEYTNQFPRFISGASKVIVKMGFDRLLEKSKIEYCKWLQYKNTYKKFAIHYLRRKLFIGKREHSIFTYLKIREKIEYLKSKDLIQEKFNKEGILVVSCGRKALDIKR